MLGAPLCIKLQCPPPTTILVRLTTWSEQCFILIASGPNITHSIQHWQSQSRVWYFTLVDLVLCQACVCLPARNGLVNKVEFPIPQKYLKWRLTVVREVPCTNYQSRNLIGPYHFWRISPRNSLYSPDRFFPGGARGLGTRLS